MHNAETPAAPTGHPRGIYTLYFTEMWERMSYYGMRALLILYMTAGAVKGGLGLDKTTAGAIYGLYTCAVYLVTLPGGWIADRLIGPQRAVFVGGCIIAAGHFTLAIPDTRAFFIGLLLVVMGTALLKPNVSALVGQLYPEGGARRDSGFTLFYMGINLGAFIGPLVCGYLGEEINWHYGFAAAGVGMVFGLIQYAVTRRHLGEAGARPSVPSPAPGRDWALVWATVAAILVVVVLALTGVVHVDPVALAKNTSKLILGMAALWFLWAFMSGLLFGKLTPAEMKRLVVLVILFFAAALFWSGFEQVGSVMNLFARDYTNRVLFGWEAPTGWFQSINPLLILALAVPVSTLWLWLAGRRVTPSFIAKFAGGLLLLASGFVLMYFAAKSALSGGGKVSPLWLCLTYFLHTVGELFLSPVGLSAVTKLAPAKLTSQALGIWFLGAALGNLLAGLLAGGMSEENVANMPTQFMHVALIAGAGGLLLLIFTPLIKKLMPGVE